MANNFKPILYGIVVSPSVQAVLLTLKALKVDYEFRVVNIKGREQLSAEYLKKNPARTIPTLEFEPGRFIGDSHAIMAYLVGRYGANDDPLYPKELYKRAKVDELLHFENGVLFITCVKQTLQPIFSGKRNDVPVEKLSEIEKAFDTLESFFGDHAFVAGAQLTIADFSCFVSINSLLSFKKFDEEKHPKLHAWFAHMKSLPYAEEVVENEAVLKVGKFVEKKLAKL